MGASKKPASLIAAGDNERSNAGVGWANKADAIGAHDRDVWDD